MLNNGKDQSDRKHEDVFEKPLLPSMAVMREVRENED